MFDQSRGTHNTNSGIGFKTTILKSSLCDCSSNAYILVKGKMTITGAGNNAGVRRADEQNKGVVFENCVPFIKSL